MSNTRLKLDLSGFQTSSMTLIHVRVKGLTPYMMHAFTSKALESVMKKTRKKKTSNEDKSLLEMAEEFAYRDQDSGELYIPGTAMQSAIIAAGTFQQQGKRKLTTARGSLVSGAVMVPTQKLWLGTKEFAVDVRRVVNQNTGNAQAGVRPIFHDWEVEFALLYNNEVFDEGVVRRLVDDAGTRIGIGSFRPERKGNFGMFVVTHWEDIAERDGKRAA